MIKKCISIMTVCMAIILIFPVSITLLLNQVNQNKPKNSIVLSGKTIILENDSNKQTIDLEYFIPCVLMAEVSIDSPIEELKAQAVIIRTYILNKMGKNDTISSKELNLPYITYPELKEQWYQTYIRNNIKNITGILCNITGMGKSIPYQENRDYLYSIIEKTNLKVLKKEGELILPLFHETSNGKTRNGSEILGKKYDYLKSVSCKTDSQNNNYIGIQYFSLEEFADSLKKHGIIVYKDKQELFSDNDMDVKSLLEIINIDTKDKEGYQLVVKIGDTKIEGETFAKALGLNSTSMEIEEYEKGIRITTKGVGHGFGMSLSYAKQLAKDGMQWKDVLKTFYDASIVDY